MQKTIKNEPAQKIGCTAHPKQSIINVRHGFWKKKAVLASRKFMEKNKTINARKKSGVALLGIIIMWLSDMNLQLVSRKTD